MLKTALLTAAIVVAGLSAALAEEPNAVLELFTSQGCASCPPADALLSEYADRDDVLALSLPVDYWDYLGWQDTLARHEYTERQKAYAAVRGDRQVYTPQIVVNGRDHVVGSDRAAVEAALAKVGADGLPVSVTLRPGSDSTTVTIGAAEDGFATTGTIWLALYDDEVTVPIERGENSGRTITYSNVVRKLRRIAMWKGEEVVVELPKSELNHADVSRCAVILQTDTSDGLPGPILGAAAINYDRE